MTNFEKQIILNHSLKDPVYFAKTYLKMKLTPEQEEFIRRLQEGSEQMFIRAKINESLSRLNEQDKNRSAIPKNQSSKFKPKNGSKIDLKNIIEVQKTDKLKNL